MSLVPTVTTVCSVLHHYVQQGAPVIIGLVRLLCIAIVNCLMGS